MFARLIALLGLMLVASNAFAQNSFPTGGGGGPRVPGNVPMCLDSASPPNAVPCSGGTQGVYNSAGAGQYNTTVATATALTVPSGAKLAEICVATADVRYRDDGTDPTSTVGMPVSAGTCFPYAGPLSAVKFIAQSGSPTINVSYYK